METISINELEGTITKEQMATLIKRPLLFIEHDKHTLKEGIKAWIADDRNEITRIIIHLDFSNPEISIVVRYKHIYLNTGDNYTPSFYESYQRDYLCIINVDGEIISKQDGNFLLGFGYELDEEVKYKEIVFEDSILL